MTINKEFSEILSDYLFAINRRDFFCPHCEKSIKPVDEIPVMILENNLKTYGSKLAIKYGLLEYTCPKCAKEVTIRMYSNYYKEKMINDSQQFERINIELKPIKKSLASFLSSFSQKFQGILQPKDIARIHFLQKGSRFFIKIVTNDKDSMILYKTKIYSEFLQYAKSLISKIEDENQGVVYLGRVKKA
jgi:hypothetical protein